MNPHEPFRSLSRRHEASRISRACLTLRRLRHRIVDPLTVIAALAAASAVIVGGCSTDRLHDPSTTEAPSAVGAAGSDAAAQQGVYHSVISLPSARSSASSSLGGATATATDAAIAERLASQRLRQIPIITGPFDEVWVIATKGTAATPGAWDRRVPAPQGDRPGCGVLETFTTRPDGTRHRTSLPLAHVDVDATVSGPVASVGLRQRFHNPFADPIEAYYAFPLPVDAAVSDFVLVVGERRIRGVVREREEAMETYDEAKAAGKVAALLVEERPNVFVQRVANVEPGRWVDVEMTWYGTVGYADGWHEWVFPMVIGARYNPPGGSTSLDAVAQFATVGTAATVASDSGDRFVSRPQFHTSNASAAWAPRHFVDVRVAIDAGVPISEIRSPSHRIESERPHANTATVRLSERDRTPDRDFVLRWKVGSEASQAAVVTSRDADGGTFLVALYPPIDTRQVPQSSLEMIFVVDRSGSMGGTPLEQAKSAIRTALGMLEPRDTVQIVDFSNAAATLSPYALPATRQNLAMARKYVDGLRPGGGTMMLGGLRTALTLPPDPHRVRHVVFLTDGFIGNEADVLAATHADLGTARVFSFGVGSSVNRWLLDGMARLGRGATTVMLDGDDAKRTMRTFMEVVRRPALHDITVDFGGLLVRDVVPATIPDLHSGRPVVIIGRFDGTARGVVTVEGTVDDVRRRFDIPVDGGSNTVNPALSRLWARATLAEISLAALRGEDPSGAPQRIRSMALAAGILSPYTGFVAVDAR